MSEAEVDESSNADDVNLQNDDEHVQSAQSEEAIEIEYNSQRMEEIFKRWYSIDFNFRMKFPDGYSIVPPRHLAERVWLRPMDYEEVSNRLLGLKANEGQDQLAPAIIKYFEEIVQFASQRFADVQLQLTQNEHHLETLKRAQNDGKIPHFLQMKTVEVRFFPEDEKTLLQQEYRKILDDTANRMHESTLKMRYSLGAKLCRKAEVLMGEVHEEAVTKWMEAQGTQDGVWNRWDHIFRVTAEIKEGDPPQLVRRGIPLSATIFRIAMMKCRSNVSTLLEASRLKKAEEEAARRKEEQARRAALAQVSALPRQETQQRIERRFEDMLKPVLADIRSIKEQIQINGNAPAAAGTGGATKQSAMNLRITTNAILPSEPQTGKKRWKKRRKITEEGEPAEFIPVRSVAVVHDDDHPKRTGCSGGSGSARSHRKRRAAEKDQH
jgi:hypothetical protein